LVETIWRSSSLKQPNLQLSVYVGQEASFTNFPVAENKLGFGERVKNQNLMKCQITGDLTKIC
jgi:hypothetical protein